MNARELPIYEIAGELRRKFRQSNRLILQAETGSGKSTQVPQILLDGSAVASGQIVILQPRRLAARMLARFVADDRAARLGDEVGYQIRFNDVSGPRTRIKYVTEGILLRQALGDPALRRVHTIIFDEFHERHLYGDVSLGLALRIQASRRPDLKIVVMSATLDSDALEKFLQPCEVVRSEGRAYPVRVEYLPRPWDDQKTTAWEMAAREFDRLAPSHNAGHVLVFMPGAYEIMRTVDAIRALAAARGMTVLPLHGELSEADQDRAVAPGGARRVIVATNVAETSLTIEGVRLVIDSGLARMPRFDPHRGINTLLTEKISRDSAEQRAGRAGRTAPGHCLRLWTEHEHQQRAPRIIPEIQRLDLAEIALTLKATGLPDADAAMGTFPWLDPPPPKSVERTIGLLRDLDAIDAAGAITPLGRRLVSFPAHPRFARMLVAAGDYGCVPSAALIAALTQEKSVLVRRTDSTTREMRDLRFDDDAESDLLRLMRVWEYARDRGYDLDECRRLGIHALSARRVERVREYFLDIAGEQGLDTREDRRTADAVGKCILTGFSDQLARRTSAGSLRFALVHRRTGTLAKESVVRGSPLLVAAEIREVETRRDAIDVLLSLCSAVKEEWLRELFPGDFSEGRSVWFDAASKRVLGQRETRFRDLVLDSTPLGQPAPEEAAPLLAKEVLAGRLTLKHWDHAVEQWILRVNGLARWCPELGVPALAGEERAQLIEHVCLGAFGYKDLKDKPVWPVVKAWLSGAQQALLDRHAPVRLELPNGRKPAVTYNAEGSPFIALRIQELYGVSSPLRIAMGRVPVVVHVLAPNQRPVQITEDLAGFWQNDYPRVKKELQRKYPKHEWR